MMMALMMHHFSIALIGLIAALLMGSFRADTWQFCWRIFKRMRWVWLSIMLVMALTTPGQIVAGLPGELVVTYQGLQQGGMQIARLSLMLMLIALMTTALSRDQQLIAFYCLSLPLRWLGISPVRLATRLWLTIHYIETHQASRNATLLHDLLQFDTQPSHMPAHSQLTLRLPSFGLLDTMICALMLTVIFMGWMQ